ncbi:MAG: DUF305 domain-containing protein [Acidimicrobiales bacterium]
MGTTTAAPAPPGVDDEAALVGGPPGRPGLSWRQLAVLVAAVAFLGGALGYVLGTRSDRPDADSVDVGFYQDMITHHEQALEMAVAVLADGSDPSVRSFAREILQLQSYEIGLMTQRLVDWGYDPADRPDSAMSWMGHALPVDVMPGLATPDQMRALRDAQGPAVDALFLVLMAAHHVGGVDMAEYAADHASGDDVRDLAAAMARNQRIEINEFANLAERLGLDVDIARPATPGEVDHEDHSG